ILFTAMSAIFKFSGDTISPDQDRLPRTEGKFVTLKCNYQTYYSHPQLHWYKHDSDLQAPQFILWKGGKRNTVEHIPDNRYESRTTDTSTELIITKLTLADTALYYCRLYKNLKTDMDYSSKRREVVFKAQLHIRWILFIPSFLFLGFPPPTIHQPHHSLCNFFFF
uniref:Ig-like domain-containing protein n=1 Tax=Oryzias melastigma TaxID=30732 RepID=A0A3B3DGY5_ORYME